MAAISSISGVSSVVFLVSFFAICWWCGWCQKKKSTTAPGYNMRARVDCNHNTFKKGEELKTKIVNSTEFEKDRFEEFEKLEAKVAEGITPIKSTVTSREEKNSRHNRYSDIGKINHSNSCSIC